jgi:hypothetical protein
LVRICLRSIGRTETGNYTIEVLGLVELQHSRRAFEDHGLTG